MADTASPSGYELLETIGNYRELLWTIVKCFWVAGDLTVLDWDLPAPRGFGVLRGDWRGLGVALRRWEAPRALVGVGGFEALRVLCQGRAGGGPNEVPIIHGRTEAIWIVRVYQSINLSSDIIGMGKTQRMCVKFHMTFMSDFPLQCLISRG
jgi:hypothetical protein